jgi:hypothetical protein
MSKISTETVKVLLPMIRNVMPGIIANDIIGVQKMSAPSGEIFTVGKYQVKVRLTKEHYRHFLRVYNRRQYHTVNYINSLGYPSVKLSRRDDVEYNALKAKVWAITNLKLGTYINSGGTFWFAREKDYTLFLLRWS